MADPNHNLKDRLLNDLGSTFGSPADRIVNQPVPTLPIIPDHTLLRCIGKGSYGEVWLARNALGTLRAVKIVYRRAFDSDRPYDREFAGIRRFEPVSRSHPSQLNVLHVGRDDATGLFYYVMELADDAGTVAQVTTSAVGAATAVPDPETYVPRTIRSEIQMRGRLPCADCVDLGTALATALDHLHRHGLVHRDIKPSNIIFVKGIPKLADIGLVTRLEATLSFVGTEGYVPPEGPGTPQADIYSFGKVLYEMSTGRDRQDYPELPTGFIEVDAAERSALAELNEVIVKACHPDAKQRYQTATELHADLALLQSGKSVSRMRAVERRLQFVQRAGALVTGLALVIAAGWWWQARQTTQIRQLVAEKSSLADENRVRVLRLDIANGVRLLDEGDPSGALLWFADSLPLVTNNPAEEAIHRIRIQQTLSQTPRVLRVFPHDSEVASGDFSPDGLFIATGTKVGGLRVWNAADGSLVWGPTRIEAPAYFLRFSRDGERLFASSAWEQGPFNGRLPNRAIFVVLDAATGRKIFPEDETQSGMPTNAVAAHLSPDDRWLAVSLKGGVIRLFDVTKGHPLTDLKGHTDNVGFLTFSADGSLLASASLDRTVRLWHLPSGEPVGPPLEHRWPVARALLTDDSRRLITASFARPGSADLGEYSESEVQAWDVPNRRRLGDPIPTGGWISMFVAPGNQNRFLVDGVMGGEGVRACSFDAPGKVIFEQDAGFLHVWHLSKDGRRLAMAGGDSTARIFDAQTGAPVTLPLRHGRWGVNAVKFGPDENQLLTTSADGVARLWDLRPMPTESLRRTLPASMQQLPPEAFRSAQGLGRLPGQTPVFLTDARLRLFGEDLEELHLFRNPHPGMKFRGISSAWASSFWAMERYDPDAKALLLWRPEGEETRGFMLEHPDEVQSHVFTGDDRFLVTTCRDRVVRFWRTSDGALERTVELPEAAKGEIGKLSPDGKTAAWFRATHPGVAIQFLDLESGQIIGNSRTLQPTIFGFNFSPNGESIAFPDQNGPVTVLESRTGRVISSTIAHTSNLIWVEWNPDGRRLLTAGHDDQVLVWDVETGTQLLGPLRTPGGIIRVARWSPDGQFIIARNDEKQVRVWDSATGEAVTPPLNHTGDVAFAFMTRSNRLISASYPDLLRAWDLKKMPLPPDILADYAKLLSGRRLSASGALLALKSEELAELNRSLRVRAPQLFE